MEKQLLSKLPGESNSLWLALIFLEAKALLKAQPNTP
jgi:hypothetical protein